MKNEYVGMIHIFFFSIDICQLRIDFDTFSTGQTATTGTCTDSFRITGPSNTNSMSPLCGTLTNQHSK